MMKLPAHSVGLPGNDLSSYCTPLAPPEERGQGGTLRSKLTAGVRKSNISAIRRLLDNHLYLLDLIKIKRGRSGNFLSILPAPAARNRQL